MAAAVEANTARGRGELDGSDISPGHPAIQQIGATNNDLEPLSMRADPDASATVTDFLDFTEHLPSDITRSLTLIAQLDSSYIDSSAAVNELTTIWGKLPTLPPNERIDPVKLRAAISNKLNYALSSRTYAHAEACRMLEIISRHHNRIQTILGKLHTMRDNFPTVEERVQRSPIQSKSPQMIRGPKITLRLDSNGEKMQPRRIIVPGEVLGPHEIDYNVYSDSSDDSSEDEISVSPPRRPITEGTRIKLVKPSKAPKQQRPPKPSRPARPNGRENGLPPVSTSTALAKLKPPPENAVPGSTDAPWLQLTQYELAKLRKRMKKNSQWIPSDTMIARELKNLGRGVEAFKDAQKQAEEEGKPFEPTLPAPVVDAESGIPHPPEGAISADALTADEVQLSNRGMKLNEAKKLKRETLARMAAEEAEESARKMVAEAARLFPNHEASPSVAGSSHDKSQDTAQSQGKASSKSKAKKRKRDSLSETPVPEKPQSAENIPPSQAPSLPPTQSERPQIKRTKTETPVPPPQMTPRPPSAPPQPAAIATTHLVPVETPVPVPQLGRTGLTSKTPVPVPVPITVPSDSSIVAVRTAASSGQTSPVPPSTITTVVPTKPPAETPVPPPVKTSTTPILPPARDLPKRETRQNMQPATVNLKQPSSSRSNTPAPAPAPVPEPQPQPVPLRRPVSRGGKAASQEPPPTLAAERPRRASTARNTPAPEIRQPSKRAKRPAPGVVTTNFGGTSAIGKRKAAPRKKARGSAKREKGTNQQPEPEVEVEVDDDGNVVDPDEPRYCLCNRVSFGTMIQCDNIDVSKIHPKKSPPKCCI
ncbi:hypothetical protein E0Z10_g1031 [Xylaria hypoxylon]|uniref:Inhibitor of growth protein N-terminal histone-binding domain-containing protein n=1 Tax=Xylaria hypoxylon TaxID=37992 RepID=A0A4Z0Z878_9PEZI|nr:hypothetical protein E0Z10_g1031 [Xylaria hypoxylon]